MSQYINGPGANIADDVDVEVVVAVVGVALGDLVVQ